MKRTDRYKNSPTLERDKESGKMGVKRKETGTEKKSDETAEGTAGMEMHEMHQRHSKERFELGQKHEKEHLEMSHKHEKEMVGEHKEGDGEAIDKKDSKKDDDKKESKPAKE